MLRPISTTWPLPPTLTRVHGDGEEHERPEDGGGFADERALAVVGVGAEAHVEVDDGGGGK